MFNATLLRRTNLTEDLYIFHIKPDDGVPDFKSGQYVVLGLAGEAKRPEGGPPDPEEVKPDKIIKRSYSIASSPDEKDALEFYIVTVNEGLLTPRLSLLNDGDRLVCGPKIVGTFTLDMVPEDSNLVLVATGTGLAPYISMVRTKSVWTPERKISILHGVRYSQDLAYKEELEQLAKDNPNFQYFPIISREDPEWHGRRGYVQSFITEGTVPLDAAKDHVFVCGNPGMIEELETSLVGEKGYSVHSRRNPGNLHLEKYW